MKKYKIHSRLRRHKHVRKKIHGTAERPRVSVYRSSKHIYVQAVDDINKTTIASAASLNHVLPEVTDEESTAKVRVAKAVGKLIGERLKEKGIESVVFDRGGYLYHGRVAALADGAREAGLKF